MNVQDLQIFVEVARFGSFAEVARRSDRDPSLVSRAISGLEAELDFRLFQRSTRRLTLTEAGQCYFEKIMPLLADLQAATEEAQSFRQQPKGKLRLTASTAFGQVCVLPLVQSFALKFPDIELELLFTDENLDLLKEDIDIACRLTPAFDSGYVGRKLFDTHYKVVASPAYIKSHPEIKQPKDLVGVKCLAFSLAKFRSRWVFSKDLKSSEEIPITPGLVATSALALRECAVNGLGPALLADWMVDDIIEDGVLVELFPGYRVTATDFNTAAWMIYPSRKQLPIKVKLMMDHLKKGLTHEQLK